MFFRANNNNISKIRNWSNNSCSQFDSIQNLINFEDVISCSVSFLDKSFHGMIDFIGTKVNLD